MDFAIFSCFSPHSSRSAPKFPSDRFSRAANPSNSSRTAGRIRNVTLALHSPMNALRYRSTDLNTKELMLMLLRMLYLRIAMTRK